MMIKTHYVVRRMDLWRPEYLGHFPLCGSMEAGDLGNTLLDMVDCAVCLKNINEAKKIKIWDNFHSLNLELPKPKNLTMFKASQDNGAD